MPLSRKCCVCKNDEAHSNICADYPTGELWLGGRLIGDVCEGCRERFTDEELAGKAGAPGATFKQDANVVSL